MNGDIYIYKISFPSLPGVPPQLPAHKFSRSRAATRPLNKTQRFVIVISKRASFGLSDPVWFCGPATTEETGTLIRRDAHLPVLRFSSIGGGDDPDL